MILPVMGSVERCAVYCCVLTIIIIKALHTITAETRSVNLYTLMLRVLAISTQVFLVLLGPRRKYWDGSHFSSKLPLHASHVAVPN